MSKAWRGVWCFEAFVVETARPLTEACGACGYNKFSEQCVRVFEHGINSRGGTPIARRADEEACARAGRKNPAFAGFILGLVSGPFRDGWTVARFMLDTNLWITTSDPSRKTSHHYPDVHRLFDFYETGRIMLGKAGMMDVERIENALPEDALQRLDETAEVLEAFGPMIVGHARLDHSVMGGEYDDRGIDRVLSVVHPGSDRYGTSTTAIHNLRDAIHVWTAIRNGWTAFVSEDPAVINANVRMIQQSDWSLRLLSPAQAVRWTEREIEKGRIRAERRTQLD